MTWGRKGAEVHMPLQKSFKKQMGLVMIWVCVTTERKTCSKDCWCGAPAVRLSVRQPVTAGFVPKPRNLCYTSLHHNFVLNLKYFNCLFHKAILNYECLLKQKAATPWQFDGTLSSTGLFIFLLASEFLMNSGYP